MSGYVDYVSRDRRYAVLRLLSETSGMRMNEAVLRLGLRQVGHEASLDMASGDLSWLSEQGFVRVSESGVADLRLVELTRRGEDVARGSSEHPGVARAREWGYRGIGGG